MKRTFLVARSKPSRRLLAAVEPAWASGWGVAVSDSRGNDNSGEGGGGIWNNSGLNLGKPRGYGSAFCWDDITGGGGGAASGKSSGGGGRG